MNPHSKFIVRARAVILHGGKLLVVKHSPSSSYHALPGGHLEPGETPDICVKREILEELGVEPTLGRLLYIHIFKDQGVTDTLEFFFEVMNGEDFVNLDGLKRTHSHELSEILWADEQNDLNLLPKSIAEDFKAGKVLSDQIRYTKG